MSVSDEPADRLTRMGNELIMSIEAHPEWLDGDRTIVFISDDEYSGIAISGFTDPEEATVDLFMHLKAIMQATGRDLEFIGVPESPEGLED